MAKRKKYQKLPNGFGSIKYLGKGRRNPYGVYPPVTGFTLDGQPVQGKAICYVDSWIKGFAVLNAWHAGSYTPGMELGLTDTGSESTLAQRMLADYSRRTGTSAGKTFEEVYGEYYQWKYDNPKGREYSKSSLAATRTAYKHCRPLYGMEFAGIRHADMQALVDGVPGKRATISNVVLLLHQMYKYAMAYEIVDTDRSANIRINIPDDTEHGTPYSDDDLRTLWANRGDDTAAMLLVMCYSGFRASAYRTMDINMDGLYFRGGIKNKYSKGRTVPMHSGIVPLVGRLLDSPAPPFALPYRTLWDRTLALGAKLGLARHTPHDCRHTFSALCERYGVRENDRKRMLGHAVGDVTNDVYGHRTLEELRSEIEKIQIIR